ncbi:porin [Pontibacter aydingkolensis]|uniref:Porin n=2 Tax=Pontibacter aydingkolensis TaxID=1911536 RepID=A0ABS7CYR6_9BACT|nr:porin [Pontibacter aydingkolensis]
MKAFAQQDSILSASPEVTFSGFADIFYAYDFNKPTENDRQPFLYNHNRHNEFNLNLALIRASIEHTRYRGNIAIQAGTYAMDNYAAEEDLLKHIFEANAGIALNPKRSLWMDVGIFGSHIGFESAISSDNLTLTRSLLAENSPYYLSGAKVSYIPNAYWTFAALIVNGWQRIKRIPGNSLLSFGTQLTYSKNDNNTLNWSTFIGTDEPDATRRMRYFNNLYGQFNLNERLTLITGFDIGAQQKYKGSSSYDIWYSPVVIARYQINEQWATAARAEYYSDENGVIISLPVAEEFKTAGVSVNVDYAPFKNILCRAEARWLKNPHPIFEYEGVLSKSNVALVGSLAFQFTK